VLEKIFLHPKDITLSSKKGSQMEKLLQNLIAHLLPKEISLCFEIISIEENATNSTITGKTDISVHITGKCSP
jgi:hypothetical protein